MSFSALPLSGCERKVYMFVRDIVKNKSIHMVQDASKLRDTNTNDSLAKLA
jgi:hypothetical protein